MNKLLILLLIAVCYYLYQQTESQPINYTNKETQTSLETSANSTISPEIGEALDKLIAEIKGLNSQISN